MIGWFGTAMLCYVTPKEHLGPARPRGRQGRRHRLQDRRPRRRPRQGPPGRAGARRRAVARRASSSAGRTSSTCRSTRRRRATSTTRRCRADAAKTRALLLDVRAEVLLDEDHPGRARLRRPRRGSRAERRAGRRACTRRRRSSSDGGQELYVAGAPAVAVATDARGRWRMPRLVARPSRLASASAAARPGDDPGPAGAGRSGGDLRADVRALPRRRRARRSRDPQDAAACATSHDPEFQARATQRGRSQRMIMAGKGQMPAFGGMLSLPKIQSLSGYVRRLGKSPFATKIAAPMRAAKAAILTLPWRGPAPLSAVHGAPGPHRGAAGGRTRTRPRGATTCARPTSWPTSNKCKAAIPEYTQGDPTSSRIPTLLFNRAECYRRTGEAQKAIADYRTFLDAAPGRAESRAGRGADRGAREETGARRRGPRRPRRVRPWRRAATPKPAAEPPPPPPPPAAPSLPPAPVAEERRPPARGGPGAASRAAVAAARAAARPAPVERPGRWRWSPRSRRRARTAGRSRARTGGSGCSARWCSRAPAPAPTSRSSTAAPTFRPPRSGTTNSDDANTSAGSAARGPAPGSSLLLGGLVQRCSKPNSILLVNVVDDSGDADRGHASSRCACWSARRRASSSVPTAAGGPITFPTSFTVEIDRSNYRARST